jgi:hypothetical protein
MSKAADIERLKLSATFYNNVAIGFLFGGAFASYVNILQQKADDWRTWGLLFLGLVGAVGCRMISDRMAREIPD